MKPFDKVKIRSQGKCEAMVFIEKTGAWTRCWRQPVEVHHMLTRGRGGAVLDKAGEVYHLIALCPRCHAASDGGEAYDGELLIDGYVITDEFGQPKYSGSDKYLRRKYGDDKPTKEDN